MQQKEGESALFVSVFNKVLIAVDLSQRLIDHSIRALAELCKGVG